MEILLPGRGCMIGISDRSAVPGARIPLRDNFLFAGMNQHSKRKKADMWREYSKR